jgi:hypothetical protein
MTKITVVFHTFANAPKNSIGQRFFLRLVLKSVQRNFNLYLSIFECDAAQLVKCPLTFLRNKGNRLSDDAKSHSRRSNFSITGLWKPQILPETTVLKHFVSFLGGNYFYCRTHNVWYPVV